MANTASSLDACSFRLDIEQLQLDVQRRWLRPPEVAEILRNYQMFKISTKPPDRPPSGSLFLFNRKVLKHFRKDGHIWSKKKDGKTVKEAHENLKVGSVNVLHVYYAVAEENPCFRRRVYFLLDKKFRDINFVHYLEIEGRSTSKKTHSVILNSRLSNSFSSSVSISHNEAYAGNTESPSAASTLTSTTEDIKPEIGAKIDQNRSQKDKNAQIRVQPNLSMYGPKIIGPYYIKSEQIF